MAGQPKTGFYVVVGLVVVALVGFAVWRLTRPGDQPTPPGNGGKDGGKGGPKGGAKELDPKIKEMIHAAGELPKLDPPGEYKPQGDTIDVEISDWPGYAPLIWANNGLEPNPDSYFAKMHGFKLKIVVSEAEAEGWSRLNSGKTGVSVTTVDVLALYANQLKVEVPIQLDFSRGGDGILTLKTITNINQLKGRRVAVAQYTEAEFFLRFLAQEVGLGIKPLAGPEDSLGAEQINLVYTKTAEEAAEAFKISARNGDGFLSGAVTWSPFTVEIPQELPDQVRLLVTNRNLLVVADILVVNAAFARKNPKIVQGLVDGILTGAEEIRKDPDRTLPVVARSFKDDSGKPRTLEAMKELMKDVHLSNHAENMLFFSTDPGQTGTFGDIYYTALYAYGQDTKAAVPPQKLFNRSYLEKLADDPRFKDQKVTLGPVKTSEKASPLEADPVLVKQIRFHFDPNSTELDLKDEGNQQALKDLDRLLKRAPGSYFMLVGHLDNSRVEEFRQLGEAVFRRRSMQAVEQSKKRAESVKKVLEERHSVDPKRIESDGKGWDDPLAGAKPEENRRVEVRFYTLE